ncbi:MAG: UDP-N-acetylmuramate dehydrogenase [Actinomycetota bacterium]
MSAVARRTDAEAIAAGLRAAGQAVEVEAPFGALTTYGVGGPAALTVEVVDAGDARAVGTVLSSHPGTDVFVLGNGSNTLVADDGFDGVVVRTRPPRDPAAFEVRVVDGTVSVGAWMPLPVLARRSVAAGAHGLEWAVGVPGTVGGAVRMNAGGHGAEMVDSLVSVEIVSLVTGASAEVPAAGLGLHFRGSAIGPAHLVTRATFAVSPPGDHDGEADIAAIVAWRREHQPGGRNAGSVFVNPSPGEWSAGALIDAAGMRGVAVGGAAVSEKHANFIQAGAGATAADVVALMETVQDTVRDRTGTVLRSEVRMIGFGPAVTARFAGESHDDPAVVAARKGLARMLGETA